MNQKTAGSTPRKTHDGASRLILAVVVLLVGWLVYPLFDELVHYWQSDQETTHGFLIPLISLYLLWSSRERLSALLADSSRSYSPLDGVVLVGALGLFLYAKFTEMTLIQGLALLVLLGATVKFLYGNEVFKVALVPIGFLVFMLPIPFPIYYAMADPLKGIVAQISTATVSFLGADARLVGNTIHMDSIPLQLHVHETCSGIRTILSFLALGILVAILFLESFAQRALLVTFAIVMAFVVNVVRVTLIAVLAFFVSPDVGLDFHSHGWILVTPVGIISTIVFGEYLRCRSNKTTTPQVVESTVSEV